MHLSLNHLQEIIDLLHLSIFLLCGGVSYFGQGLQVQLSIPYIPPHLT